MLSWLKQLLGPGFLRFDATVEVIGLLPPAFPDERQGALLYRVITPTDLAGSYGVTNTLKKREEVDALAGKRFSIWTNIGLKNG